MNNKLAQGMTDMIYFTTTKPSGFLSGLDSNGPIEPIIHKYGGKATLAESLQENVSIYIDGALETMMGFDIPWILSGDIKDVPVQDAVAVYPFITDDRAMEEYPAKLVFIPGTDDFGKRRAFFVLDEVRRVQEIEYKK